MLKWKCLAVLVEEIGMVKLRAPDPPPPPSIPLPPRLPIKLFYAPPPMILLLPIHPYHQMDQNLVAPMRIILILLFTKKFIF